MKDNHFAVIALLAIGGALVWYYVDTQDAVSVQNPPGQAALPVPWDTPMSDVYDANPAAYSPATPASLTLNIPNQALSLLSDQYTPLFGFVGVAQGQMYE